MKVAIFGGTGYAGGAIASELESRGHEVVRIARTPDEAAGVVTSSVHDAHSVAAVTAGADVIVVAVRASSHDANPPLAEAIPALGALVATTGQRLGVVGGAGGLRLSEGGPRLFDQPGFPDAIRPESQAHGAVVEALEATDSAVDWFYQRPAQVFGSFAPGERTGSYRIGGDVLLTAEDGSSKISGADYAIAFADEIERPAHHRATYAVAY